MKEKMIRICTGLLLALYMTVMFAPQEAEAVEIVSDYLQNNDVIVIYPAENLDEKNGKRVSLGYNTDGWSLTIQNNNVRDGNDVHMWQYGVSGKLKVDHYNEGDGAGHYFCLRAVNFRETPSSRFMDVEGKSTKDNANIHVWKETEDNVAKWFGLVDDGDGSRDTFYIYNRHSGKYLAPEYYFDTDNTDYDDRQCLQKEKNTVLSSNAFRWRIEVINRTPESLESKRMWISKLKDGTAVAELNIPGTHDAATANVEGSWQEGYNVVACQKYFIKEQLQIGVRAMDLRIRKKDDELLLVHGSSDWAVCHTEDSSNDASNLTMDMVMEEIKSFLDKNNQEFVIATVKVDGGKEKDAADAFKKIAETYKDLLYKWDKDNPTVGDVRGKLVLFSRIGSLAGGMYGPDLSQWDNNYDPHANKFAQKITEDGSNPAVYVQDAYNGDDENKKKYVLGTIQDLSERPENYKSPSGNPAFVFNYTSSQVFALHTPLDVARKMNSYLLTSSDLEKYFEQEKRMGIVVMDYVEELLCRRIIETNSKYEDRISMNPNSMVWKNELPLSTQWSENAQASVIQATAMQTPAYASAMNMSAGSASAFYMPSQVQAGNAMLLSKSDSISEVDGDGYKMEILWPELTPIVYGHTLNEIGIQGGAAVLTEEGGSKKIVYGTFRFRDSDIAPKVSDSGVTKYVLEFVPMDSGYQTTSREVTVTVRRCPLDLFIGNYEQEYGSEAASWRNIVNVTGRIAEQDEEKLRNTSMTLTKDGKEYLLEYTGNTTVADVLPAGLPVGTKGDIKIAYRGKDTREDFPDYDISNSDKGTGTWEIVPRELTIEWNGVRHYLKDEEVEISADVGNIYNDEDVDVEVQMGLSPEVDESSGITTYQAELSLTGKDAGNYKIPEEMQTVSYTVGDAPKKVHNPQIRLAEDESAYTGKEVCPSVILYDDGTVIPESEYSVSYKDNVECGLATATVTSQKGGSYDITMDNYTEEGIDTSDSTSLQYEITKIGSLTEERQAPKAESQTETEKTDKEPQNNNALLYIILVCAVLLCAAGGIILANKRGADK